VWRREEFAGKALFDDIEVPRDRIEPTTLPVVLPVVLPVQI
jgi:hypothetical protein